MGNIVNEAHLICVQLERWNMLCDWSKTYVYTGLSSGLIVYSTKTEIEVDKVLCGRTTVRLKYTFLCPIKSLYPIK